MKIYTRTGDKGETSLRWGERVPKDALRVEAYGCVDETNSCIGLALAHLKSLPVPFPGGADLESAGRQNVVTLPVPGPNWPQDEAVRKLLLVHEVLTRVQRELFDLGADLAVPPNRAKGEEAKVHDLMVAQLEKDIDALEEGLPPLRHFVLPGGSQVAAALHLARCVCRRAERRVVALARQEAVDPTLIRYLNRLSDLLFMAARAVNHALGIPDPIVVWDKKK